MTEITTQQELDAALREKRLLLAYMQKGCIPCASVSPLLGMLSGLGGFLTARAENTDGGWLAEACGIDGAPTWIVFRDGEEAGRIDPAGKDAETLSVFLADTLGVSLPPASLADALAEGRRQADHLESCLAELTFRRNETSEDLLLASIRIKVCRACLECGEAELPGCVSGQIEHIRSRLLAQLQTPDGVTEARRAALDKLPDLAEGYVRELIALKTRLAAQGKTGPT